MTEFMMFGYRARLVLDMPDGPRDATGALELVTTAEMRADHSARQGFWVNTERLLEVIAASRSSELEQMREALDLIARQAGDPITRQRARVALGRSANEEWSTPREDALRASQADDPNGPTRRVAR